MPHLVGVGLRFVAVLIDGILLMIVGYLLSLVFGGSKSSGFELQGPGAFLWFAVGFAYYIFFEGTRGATCRFSPIMTAVFPPPIALET